jgi:hypothetical protein
MGWLQSYRISYCKLIKHFFCRTVKRLPGYKVQYMIIRFTFFVLILLNALSSAAQFTDTTSYYFNYAFTGNINKTQNGSSNLLDNAIRLGMKKKFISMNFNNKFVYGNQNGLLSNKDFSSSFDINLYKTFPHFYYWGLATYNSSYSLKVNNQWMSGVGIAYSVLDKPGAYLNISDGILIDHTDLDLSNGITDKYETLRNSFRINYKFIVVKGLVLIGSNFLQNSLASRSDYIIKTTNALNYKLNKWLNLATQLDYNKVNRNKRDNLLLTYGLSFERYF